jgi:hypothetical protein
MNVLSCWVLWFNSWLRAQQSACGVAAQASTCLC